MQRCCICKELAWSAPEYAAHVGWRAGAHLVVGSLALIDMRISAIDELHCLKKIPSVKVFSPLTGENL